MCVIPKANLLTARKDFAVYKIVWCDTLDSEFSPYSRSIMHDWPGRKPSAKHIFQKHPSDGVNIRYESGYEYYSALEITPGIMAYSSKQYAESRRDNFFRILKLIVPAGARYYKASFFKIDTAPFRIICAERIIVL